MEEGAAEGGFGQADRRRILPPEKIGSPQMEKMRKAY